MTNTAVLEKIDTPSVEESVREFSHFDRCDHCGYQAFFVARKKRTNPAPSEHVADSEYMELLLCKNRGDKHSPALAANGWTVLDFTDRLNEKPSPSASEID